MNCHRFRKRLPLYAGEELSPKKLIKIKNHSIKCTACEQEIRLYLNIRKKTLSEAKLRRTQSLSNVELLNMMNRTREFQRSLESDFRRFHIFKWKLAPISVVLATILLIVIVGFSVYNYLIKDSPRKKQELIAQNNKFLQLDFSIDNLDQDIKEIFLFGERIDLSNIQFLYIFKEQP